MNRLKRCSFFNLEMKLLNFETLVKSVSEEGGDRFRPWPVASEEIGVPQKSVWAVHVADHIAVAAHVETATVWGTRGNCFKIDKDVDGNTQGKFRYLHDQGSRRPGRFGRGLPWTTPLRREGLSLNSSSCQFSYCH